MAVNRKNMDQKQGRAIVALLETSTIAQAAKRAGISERTLLRWRNRTTFKQHLEPPAVNWSPKPSLACSKKPVRRWTLSMR